MPKNTCITTKESILNYLEKLRLDATPTATLDTIEARLKRLSKIVVDIDNPYEVKDALSKLNWSNNTKRLTATLYTGYLTYIGKQWTPPQYKRTQHIPFIPTEQEINTLIDSARSKQSTVLEALKETAARIGELAQVEWTDIDFQRKLLTINHPEKDSLPRTVPITDKLIQMLSRLERLQTNKVFPQSVHSLRTNFEYLRKRVAIRANNPRIKQIHFHTFRHWKATMEYHETKDIYHVRNFLGHKDINNTIIYIHIEGTLWINDDGQWTCKIAETTAEEIQLNEKGFTYVRTLTNGKPLYRKRK